jgi:hypothetical protein
VLIATVAALAAAEPRPDWSATPASRLDGELAGVLQRLAPQFAGKRVLVAPFMGNRHHLNPWAFETIAEERFAAALRAAGSTLVDDTPLRARFAPETPGLPPTIPYSTHGLVDLAALCAADVVVLGGVQVLDDTTITIYVYDGRDGRRLAKADCALGSADVSIAALTPPANRAVAAWAEAQVGARSGDGTASGFAQAAIERGAAVRQPWRTLPLPGDVVLWLEPWRRISRPRCGVVLGLTGVGQAEVIVQRRTGPGAPVVEVQAVDFRGFPWAVLRPQGKPIP